MAANISSPEQHELQTNVQTMTAQVLSVDRRSAHHVITNSILVTQGWNQSWV